MASYWVLPIFFFDLQGALCHHKLCNFCARLNHFLGVYGKNEDYHPLCFFVLLVMVYFVFLSMLFSWRKLRNKYAFFQIFSKKPKKVILFYDFLHEKCIDRKNRVHHDEEHGKTKKIAVSDFSIDPQKVV